MSGGASHQSGLNQNRFQGKKTREFWAIIPTQRKNKPKVQLPTRMAPKEENHPMLETEKVAICHQTKSCLCRKWYARRWICSTKAIYVCAIGRMVRSCLVVQKQIILLPPIEC